MSFSEIAGSHCFEIPGLVCPKSSHVSVMQLGYWHMRGFAQPIRNLLHYVGASFEDVHYTFGNEDAVNFPHQEEWLKVKYSLDLPFPNLPYLIDGPIRITQSLTILKYLAEKYGLRSSSPLEMAHEDMLECQLVDIRNRFFLSVHRKRQLTEEDLVNLKRDYNIYLSQLEAWLNTKQWLIGDRLSFVDFLAYEYLDWYRDLVDCNCFVPYPKLSAYMKRFESLEPLRDYLHSDEYRKAHILSPYAILGYRGNNRNENGENVYASGK